MKVLHILDHYKPHFSGYVFRTNYILKYQREFGIQPIIVTSPKHGSVKKPLEEIDNTRVYRTPLNDFGKMPFIKEILLMKTLEKRIKEVLEIEYPDIIHAHSPSLNGIPALRAGRRYGIPVVYEVRALWEDAAVDHGFFAEGSFKYKMSRFVESRILKRVDSLFTICEGLKREIVSRGIPVNKVTIIPNSVDTEFFSPQDYDEDIAYRYGLRDKIVYGFIGSFYGYEGIDLLIESFFDVLKSRDDVMLLLVGDGPEKEKLHKKVEEMGLLKHVIFTGKVPHEDIKRYYSVIDILVYPRKRTRLTELVTPLKPLEAMAMGKIVVGSDVGGIKELITDHGNGFLFKANYVDELTEILLELASNKKNLSQISKKAIETVRNRYNWKSSIKRYLSVYERLINSI
jgi:PEP-CTERM/exosortase A-associated glycosyltransferase